MFWALEMEPAKVYKQKVEKAYHISMACLQPSKCTDNNYTSLVVKKADNQFVLCNLHKEKTIQVPLDLMFSKGEEITFLLTGGRNKVYLSGYVLEEDEDGLFDGSDSELEGSTFEQELQTMGKRKMDSSPVETKTKKAKIDAEESSEESGEESDDEEEDDDEEDGGEEEEEEDSDSVSDDEFVSEEEATPVKLATAKSPDKTKKKSPNVNQQQQKTPSVMTPDSQVNGKTPKSKKKNKANKTPGEDESSTTPKVQKSPGTPKETTPQKMKLEGGVVAIDTKVGAGTSAKAGKRVAVYYTGRLQQNNKQFDSTTQGKGFVFQLGRGEVIKGWDIGVAGMKVGGKRKITVPAPLAYGSKGSPPVIPPNANLVFEVELRNVF